MILSFHPCFKADVNIIYAGRLPSSSDLSAIKSSKAVILPQGCNKALYQMARSNCKNIFPNFDARFNFPGKIGQIRLFELVQVPHPESRGYNSLKDFFSDTCFMHKIPFVFKYDWGGEGTGVFLVKTEGMFNRLLKQTELFEKSGHYGFLIQKYINSLNRTLRVVVIGREIISYWKIQDNPLLFGESVSNGAYIRKNVNPAYLLPSINLIKQFCDKTKINLAGFDLIFDKKEISPFLLEVNYFFGRRGLGGSEQYYRLLCGEIKNWITSLGLF